MTKTQQMLFVYGTLKNSEVGDEFYIYGSLYDVGSFPAFVLRGNKKIPGQIAVVNDKILASLDIYEGVPSLYTRERIKAHVFDDAEKAIDVWVYQFAGETDNLKEIDKW